MKFGTIRMTPDESGRSGVQSGGRKGENEGGKKDSSSQHEL